MSLCSLVPEAASSSKKALHWLSCHHDTHHEPPNNATSTRHCCVELIAWNLPRGASCMLNIAFPSLLLVVLRAPVFLQSLFVFPLLRCGFYASSSFCPCSTFFNHARPTLHSPIAQLRNATTFRFHGQVLVKCLLSTSAFRLFSPRR